MDVGETDRALAVCEQPEACVRRWSWAGRIYGVQTAEHGPHLLSPHHMHAAAALLLLLLLRLLQKTAAHFADLKRRYGDPVIVLNLLKSKERRCVERGVHMFVCVCVCWQGVHVCVALFANHTTRLAPCISLCLFFTFP